MPLLNAIAFTRRLSRNLDRYAAGATTFAELDASVQGWVNHVRYGDTWGLREHIFAQHPVPKRAVRAVQDNDDAMPSG